MSYETDAESSVNRPPKDGDRYKVIAYQRVSKQEEITGSYTFETQQQRMKEKLDQMYGKGNYELTEFKDNGVSGGYGTRPTAFERKTRPTLRKMISELQTKFYDVFVVYNLNRLCRGPHIFYEFLHDAIYPTDTQFISATEDFDVMSPQGRIQAGLVAAMDGYFRDGVKKRNQDAAATRVELGYFLGQVGYGWEWEPEEEIGPHGRRRIIPNPEERRWVIHMKDRYLSGWNGSKIAGELNTLGVAPPCHNPRWLRKKELDPAARWSAGEVCRILMTPCHAGLLRSQRKGLIQGVHYEHRFWDPEVFDQLKDVCAQRLEKFKTVTNKTAVHLLNGLVFCDCCGKRLYITCTDSTTKNYRSYRCNNGRPQGQVTCPHVIARAEWLECAVVQELESLSQKPAMRQLLLEEAERIVDQQDDDLEQKRLHLKATIKGIDDQTIKWADSYSRGIMAEEQFLEFNRDLKSKRNFNAKLLAEIEDRLENRQRRELWVKEVQKTILNFPAVWERLDLDQQRQVLSLLLEKLTVNREGRDLKVKIKIHLLPEKEMTIIYRTTRGIAATRGTPLQRLTKQQLVVLYYAGQGMKPREILQAMGLRSQSLYCWSQPILKKLNVSNLQEAYELAKERIEANLDQLPIKRHETANQEKDQSAGCDIPFVSGVLMDVFPLLAQGATVTEVGERVGLSTCTVQARKKRILQLFHTKSIFEAAERARELGILKG